MTRWDEQVAFWTRKAAGGQDVCVVRYEDMHADRAQTLERALEFTGAAYECTDVEYAAASGSFEAMRKDEDWHGAESYLHVSNDTTSNDERFIRRGKVDSWKDELNTTEIRHIEREFGPIMREMGYSLQSQS